MNKIFNFAKDYVLTGAAVTALLWGIFVKIDSKKDSASVVEKKLEAVILIQTSQQIITDSIVNKLEKVNANVLQLMFAQNALRNSYTKYLSNDQSLTKEDFLEYMQGISWEVKSSNVLDGYKIGVRKQPIK